MRTFITSLFLAAATLTLPGCLSNQVQQVRNTPPYPTDKAQSDTLDIQVFRRGTRLIATNTSAQAFGPSIVWINQEFSLPVNGFDVGQTLDLPLTEFKNNLGKRFRAGGFFATLSPKPVVLVQLESPEESSLQGFVIVDDEPR